MSLLSAFWHALNNDPPSPKLPPGQGVSRSMMELVAERRQLLLERDCFKAELLRLGYTARSLDARVQLYAQVLKAEVIGRKAS